MLVHALAIIINLGLNCRQWVGPGCPPSRTVILSPVSADHTCTVPSCEPTHKWLRSCDKLHMYTHITCMHSIRQNYSIAGNPNLTLLTHRHHYKPAEVTTETDMVEHHGHHRHDGHSILYKMLNVHIS